MTNSYSKSEVKGNKYITTSVVETIESSKEIVGVDDRIFRVIATGCYGQIKVSDGYREFIMSNPFSNHWGLVDDRTKKQILAHNQDFDKVLDMTNANFDLSPTIMANLHNKLFITRKNDEDWIVLTPENLALCIDMPIV